MIFKYIITRFGAILFNENTTHSQVAKGFPKEEIYSAGFVGVEFGTFEHKIEPYGSSASLGIKSIPEKDRMIIEDLLKGSPLIKYTHYSVKNHYQEGNEVEESKNTAIGLNALASIEPACKPVMNGEPPLVMKYKISAVKAFNDYQDTHIKNEFKSLNDYALYLCGGDFSLFDDKYYLQNRIDEIDNKEDRCPMLDAYRMCAIYDKTCTKCKMPYFTYPEKKK